MSEQEVPFAIFNRKEATDMLNIVGLDIEINRGNAAGLTFHFNGDDTPADGTKIIFQVRPIACHDHSVIEKEATTENSAVEFSFAPEDTENLEPGQYRWNACIQYDDGNEPWTVLKDWPRFRVLPG